MKNLFKIYLLLFLVMPNAFAPSLCYAQNAEDDVLSSQEVALMKLYADATTAKILGNTKQALDMYTHVVEKDKNIHAAWYEIARIQFENKNFTKCIEAIEKAIKLDDTNKWYQLLYGRTLILIGETKDAIKVYEKLHQTHPKNIEFALQLGDLYLQREEYKDAIDLYEQLENSLGFTLELALQLSELYSSVGKEKLAEATLKKLLATQPENPQYIGMLAEFYIENGEKEKALKAYKSILENNPDNPIIHLALAKFYQKEKQYNKTYFHLKKAFQNPTVDIDNKIKILLSYYELSKNSSKRALQADTLLNLLKMVHPKNAKTWAIVGDFALQNNDLAKARSAFEKVIQLSPEKYIFWETLCQILSRQIQWQPLDSIASKAITLFPAQPVFSYYKGIALSNQKKYVQAESPLNRANAITFMNKPLKTQINLARGKNYYYLDNIPASVSAFQLALDASPFSDLVMNNYAYYLSLAKTNLDKAEQLIKKALTYSPGNVYYLDTYAWVLYQQEKYKEALVVIEKAIALGGDNMGTVVEHYGDILYKNGKVSTAVKKWKNAKELGGASPEIEEKIATHILSD